MLDQMIIYTDGACSGNPGPGGWGAVLQYQKQNTELFGYEIDTTNNRMELKAAIEALNSLKNQTKVLIYTDSKYLQQGITIWIHKWIINNWKGSNKQTIKNLDLWQELHKQIHIHDIQWQWVKGHSSNIGNQLADALAVKGRNLAMSMQKVC